MSEAFDLSVELETGADLVAGEAWVCSPARGGDSAWVCSPALGGDSAWVCSPVAAD